VIGIGGIASANDALEFLIAGCRAVQVGTANFVDPGLYPRLLGDLEAWLQRQGLADIGQAIGTLDYPGLAPMRET
jgi:dihydroorotate dehydrogenase (NAD+) catalytic subunit